MVSVEELTKHCSSIKNCFNWENESVDTVDEEQEIDEEEDDDASLDWESIRINMTFQIAHPEDHHSPIEDYHNKMVENYTNST